MKICTIFCTKPSEIFANEKTANPTFYSMLCVYFDIVSLQKNFDIFGQFLNQFKINVDGIYLSKACLSDHNLSCCNLSGYCLFYCNLKTKACGSAIYVFDEIKTKQMSIKIITDGCEDVWVKLT